MLRGLAENDFSQFLVLLSFNFIYKFFDVDFRDSKLLTPSLAASFARAQSRRHFRHRISCVEVERVRCRRERSPAPTGLGTMRGGAKFGQPLLGGQQVEKISALLAEIFPE